MRKARRNKSKVLKSKRLSKNKMSKTKDIKKQMKLIRRWPQTMRVKAYNKQILRKKSNKMRENY